MIKKIIGLLLLCTTACINSCVLPSQNETEEETVSMQITLQIGVPRTIVADWDNLISTLDLVFIQDGNTVKTYNELTFQTSITVPGVPLGMYTLAVNALDSNGNLVADGSATVNIQTSGSNSVTINLSGKSDAPGSYSLDLQWPLSSGYNFYTVSTEAVLAPDAVFLEASEAGINYSGTIAGSGLAPGSHRLYIFMNYVDNPEHALVLDDETVRIWANVESNKWIGCNGTLEAVRSLDLAIFTANDPRIEIQFEGISCISGFVSSDDNIVHYTFNQSSGPFTYSIDYANRFHHIEAVLNGDPVSEGETLTLQQGENTLDIDVVSPDRKRSIKNRYTATTQYQIVFYPNNGDNEPDSFHVTDSVFIPGNILDYKNSSSLFESWNTEENGSGTIYAEGDSITLTGDLVLYAQWQ